MSIQLDESQLSAVNHAVNGCKFAIITGGAGTGKTTIIKQIAEQLKSSELAAFAGKAAARLREATGFPASTIHRLLMYQGDRFARETLSGSTVIIDEASMVSADLMAEIIRREPRKIILVGDPAQLPPVGKGQPFHDIINLYPDTVRTLTTCYRNTEAIYQAAMKIRNGEMPTSHAESDNEQWDIINTGNPEDTQRALLGWVRDGSIDFEQDIILCPRNGENDDDACTVRGLNKQIREIVNPSDEDSRIRIGDRVINTKNFADKDVWNGTTGTVHAIDDDNNIWVHLDVDAIDHYDDSGEPIYVDKVLFDIDMRPHLQLAYALTVHKSQGSQYRNVVFVALDRDSWSLLDRSLIYTAVTRAKQHCIVIGQVNALRNGIKTVKTKTTVLQELARGANL